MVGPFGKSMLKDVRKAKREIFLWTVNDVKAMKWCILKEVDGVITDDPKTYLEVCETYGGEPIHFSMFTLLRIVILNVLSRIAMVMLYWYDYNVNVRTSKQVVVVDA
jgi:phosphatidylglycerol phospholipase C